MRFCFRNELIIILLHTQNLTMKGNERQNTNKITMKKANKLNKGKK